MTLELARSYLKYCYPEYRKKCILPPELIEIVFTYLCYTRNICSWVIEYVNDTKHGVEQQWWDNEQLHREIHWICGKRYGIQKDWYKNGQLQYERHWVNGKEHGVEKIWDCHGELSFEIHWKDGKKHGIEKHWHNGKLYYKIVWDNGVKVDDWVDPKS